MRPLPHLRGYGRLAAALNRWTLRAGVPPVITVQLAMGHRMVLDCRAEAQARSLFTGQYDDGKIRILAALLPPGGVFLDAGANIGLYSVPLALVARRRGARVVAAEPFPANTARLRENLALNDLEGCVTLLALGLSSESHDAELVLREDFTGGADVGNASVAVDNRMDAEFERVPIHLARLDDVWPTLGLDRLDVAKIDVEGHEDLLLRGARETFLRHRPVILMEVNLWYFRRRGVDFETAIRAQLPPGYRFFRTREPRLRLTIADVPRPLVEITRIEANCEGLFLSPSEKVDALHQAVARALQ